MTKRAEAVGVALGFLVLAIATTYPLTRDLAGRLPGDLGDPLLTAWTLAWDADRIRHGLSGLWDAPNFFPYRHTLLYSDHLLGVALFTAPWQWLTGNPVLTYNLAYLGSIVLAGAGMYVLAGELTGTRGAAVIAGLVYACQPFRVSHLAHLQWLMTGWLPLSLWALHRYFSSWRFKYLVGAAVFFLLQSLTAAYFTYFALLPLVIVGVGEAVWWWRLGPPRARPSGGRIARQLATVALLVAVVTMPVARAYYEVRVEQGTRRTVEDIAQQSADVGDYFSAPPSLRLWSGLGLVLGRGRGEHELFPGVTALLLAIVGIIFASRRSIEVRRRVALYTVIAAVAFVLSLGVEPKAWGHSLGMSGPYAWLLRIVPGLDGLRAVARLAAVVQVALAVLAAFGMSWLLEAVAFRARQRLIALALVALAVVAEGWAAPIPTVGFDPRGQPSERAAYAYLRTLPAGAVMELPTSIVQFEPEFVYQYLTLVHRHRVVNGHSGYVTPLLSFLGGGHSPLNDTDHLEAAIAMLRGIDVRYLVIHAASFDEPAIAREWLAAVNRDTSQVISVRRFGETALAVLTPREISPPRPEVRPVPASAIRARASHSPDRLAALFDRDPDTRWLSGRPQTGDEWIELELDRPRDVRTISMRLAARSFGDYPRELAIEAGTGSSTRTLFRGAVLAEFARGLIAEPTFPRIELVLPENHGRVFRLRQLGATHRFFWSIHELELGEIER